MPVSMDVVPDASPWQQQVARSSLLSYKHPRAPLDSRPGKELGKVSSNLRIHGVISKEKLRNVRFLRPGIDRFRINWLKTSLSPFLASLMNWIHERKCKWGNRMLEGDLASWNLWKQARSSRKFVFEYFGQGEDNRLIGFEELLFQIIFQSSNCAPDIWSGFFQHLLCYQYEITIE